MVGRMASPPSRVPTPTRHGYAVAHAHAVPEGNKGLPSGNRLTAESTLKGCIGDLLICWGWGGVWHPEGMRGGCGLVCCRWLAGRRRKLCFPQARAWIGLRTDWAGSGFSFWINPLGLAGGICSGLFSLLCEAKTGAAGIQGFPGGALAPNPDSMRVAR